MQLGDLGNNVNSPSGVRSAAKVAYTLRHTSSSEKVSSNNISAANHECGNSFSRICLSVCLSIGPTYVCRHMYVGLHFESLNLESSLFYRAAWNADAVLR